MKSPFLSSEEYDERAQQLYNEGLYDEALDVLREGLSLYPNSVELHIGVGYARLAREEYAWARRAFEESLVLEPDHEDALAGLGEVLLKLGQQEAAHRSFNRILDLGYQDDVELMLQVGRTLFREGFFAEAKEFFDVAVQQAPDMAEAVALVGYAQHRLGDDDAALQTLERALALDPEHAEARIYLANILYDRGDYEGALQQFERTTPDDHWDELGIWRLMEIMRAAYGLPEDDPELKKWEARLAELTSDADDIDEMLAEIESRMNGEGEAEEPARNQLELFGSLLTNLAETKQDEPADAPREDAAPPRHHVAIEGRQFAGSWEEIVREMCDAHGGFSGRSLQEYMAFEAKRGFRLTGQRIPTHDAESFLRASAAAGLLRILR